ncbi:transcription factor domain-containing protein [Aspergillus stella-maris]|uniref:transcription factor domain-containing protein n=1 Tax=Aspergillus stella-maris TaxID=1810926 RepID=UPI003CCD7BAB
MLETNDQDPCVTYHQYGQRCTGTAPCRNCRQRLASHGTQEDGESNDPDYHRRLLADVFKLIQTTDARGSQPLIDLIRNGATFPEARCYLNQVMLGTTTPEMASSADSQGARLRAGYEVESRAPSFRSKVMDVHYLCDFAPVKVPAKPWTTVTNDDALVSHLISLYFTWDYPFYAFVDREILVKHMQMGNLQSDFCSPFLINALLANACHYSHYSEAYTVPGDVKTKGTDFLAEAERHLQNNRFEKGSIVRLASLQATLLLYERYSMVGDDDNGYIMLNQALEMAEALGIINRPDLTLDPAHMSEDMISSVKRTAWGLFQIDTIVHTNFLRPSMVHSVSIEPIDRDASKPTDLWAPYPQNRPDRPSWLSQAFDEACRLSFIARDMSQTLSPNADSDGNTPEQKLVLYNKLRDWEAQLPSTFALKEKPAPHILLLRMRYHALLINLYCDWFEGKPPFNTITGQPKQEPSTRIADPGALETALSSAREIASLTRLHKREFGMERAHQFAMYAILLALFAFLEQQSFNVLDHDFLSLTSAFSIIASRSQVGMHLFHIFRHSVKFRLQCGKWESSVAVPDELNQLFFSSKSPEIPDRWLHYSEGLQKLADNGEYIGSLDGGWQAHAASGINDMLRKYEMMARRIKCDEGKPTCRNCIRSKRDCAYANQPQDGRSNLRIVMYTPRASFATTGAEKHSLDFFLAHLRTRFPIPFSLPVFQAAHREDVLAHAVIALGAMQQVYEFDDFSAIGTWSPMSQFAMQQYGKALRLLQDRVMINSRGSPGTSPDLILVSCLFFACFECLRGSTQAAMIHMRSGLNLLRSYEASPNRGSLIPQSTMRSLFTRLDNMLIEMRGSSLSMATGEDHLEVVALRPTPEDNVHDSLNSLWNHILHGMLDSARALASGQAPSPSIMTPQADVKAAMKQLHDAFTSASPSAYPPPDGGDYGQDPDVLRMWFLLAPMLLTAHTWDPQDAWGPHNDNFARIVAHAEVYLARCNVTNPSRKRTFSFSLGIVPPLVLTATRSRDARVQAKALYLLSICNRREGIWDSNLAVQFARKTIAMDQSLDLGAAQYEDLATIRLKNRANAFEEILVDDEDAPKMPKVEEEDDD